MITLSIYKDLPLAEIEMDSRANHRVFTNGIVKFNYRNFEISIASDGADIIYTELQGEKTSFRLSCGPCLMTDLAKVKEYIDGIISIREKINEYQV